jgi:hypothetical protein
MSRRPPCIFVAAAVVVLLSGGSAHADTWPADSRSTEGAWARCEVKTSKAAVHDDVASISCSLRDTLKDNRGVYVWYQIDGYVPQHLTTGKGCCDAHSTSGHFTNHDGSISTIRWRVCRAIPWWPDNCSSTVTKYPR